MENVNELIKLKSERDSDLATKLDSDWISCRLIKETTYTNWLMILGKVVAPLWSV